MSRLFEKDGESDDDGHLNINKDYAERYDRWREKEEYEKLKSKYGEATALNMLDDGSDYSSTSESEDEDGEGWTSDVERDFFQTLASLKKKDPSIYDAGKNFFSKKEIVPPKKTKPKDKTMFLRDYERKIIVENEGKLSDEEDQQHSSHIQTYSEEQDEIKKGFKQALAQSDSEDDEILTVRKKSDKEKEIEEEEYKEWLKGKKGDIGNQEMKTNLKPLKDYWSNPSLDDNEKFLRDFILNKRYLERDDKDYIPTYDEIVHDSEGDLSEDERTLEKQTEFETKYNFRFEEPDPEFIKRYPRTVADSLRKPDDKRKIKRDEIREKKKREKEQKKEELKQLKKFKLNEIKEKLEQLKTITGNDTLPFQDDDLDEDFNPEKHDKKMQQIFNDQYYEVDEGEQKPEFPYDEEIDDENWDEYTGEAGDYDQAGPSTSGYEPHCEDPDFNMDCDYNPQEDTRKELISMSRNKRGKSRKKSVFAQKVETKKPVFDPQKYPNYEEYLEEYYKLDFEDVIGDMPVRFKYRKVVPNDFGLDTEEILSARDKELNRWCSVKKTCQYRAENEEMQDVHTFRTKKNNVTLKKKILPSLFAENPEELLVEDQENARKKRRRNQGKEDENIQSEAKKFKPQDAEVVADQPTKDTQVNEAQTTGTNNSDVIPVQSSSKSMQDGSTQESKKKKKKKRKKKPLTNSWVVSSTDSKQSTTTPISTQNSKEKSPKRGNNHRNNQESKGGLNKKHAKQSDYSLGMSDDRLKAYGFNPKKFKNQQKYGKSSKS